MSTKIDKAELDYAAGMKYKDIAKKYAVSINTVKSWKTRYKWARKVHTKKKKSVHTEPKKVCVQKNSTHTDKETHQKMVQSVADNDQLTEKRKLFCLYFVDCLNATQAYVNAYGVKRSVANAEGCTLLANPSIRKEIERLKQIKYESIMLNANDIVERQMRIAFASITDYVDVTLKDVATPIGTVITINNMTVKPSSELDGTVIEEIKDGRHGLSIKLKDSQKAMDWLTKYFEMNPQDKHKVAFDKARLGIEREKVNAMKARNKEPDKPVEPLILQPVYGRGGDNDNE